MKVTRVLRHLHLLQLPKELMEIPCLLASSKLSLNVFFFFD